MRAPSFGAFAETHQAALGLVAPLGVDQVSIVDPEASE
jgi:hypothetical protein